ncbi:MAG: beta-lactamase [Caulobacteraceae bacterium]|nr:beta-lactamase [Caulobacteraceae bacterium]
MHRLANLIRALLALGVIGGLSSGAASQTPAGPSAAPFALSPAALRDYAGTYGDGPGHLVEIVATDILTAVIDESAYPLKTAGPNEFINGGGEKIPFTRGPDGKVTGYTDSGVFHPRLKPTTSAEAVATVTARPRGAQTAADYRYRKPANRFDGLAVGDIARTPLGLETAKAVVGGILDRTYPNVHSVLLYQGGKLVLEEYFYDYNAGRQQQLRSASKSFVSAAAGIAIDQGFLPGADAPILPRLTYGSYANPDSRKSALTLGDMLTMSSGLACNDYDGASPGREEEIYPHADWVKAVMDLPQISAPGEVSHYCSGGVAVVGRVVENATHMSLPDFARRNLFRPLGIADRDWTWNYDLTNADTEYSQLHMRPRDMLKFGVMYADGGRWHGRQIVPPAWVKTSLSPLKQLDDTGYGYFWWHPYINVQTPAGVQKVEYSSAQGNGGQKIYILPQFDLVAVFTGGAYNAESTAPNKIMSGIILPRLIAAARGR